MKQRNLRPQVRAIDARSVELNRLSRGLGSYDDAKPDTSETDAFRVLHGATDGFPGFYIDRFGAFLLCSSDHEPGADEHEQAKLCLKSFGGRAAYLRRLDRHVRRKGLEANTPAIWFGEPCEGSTTTVREGGVRYRIRFDEGYSVGLFLDQSDHRRRWLQRDLSLKEQGLEAHEGHVTEILNTFAYTCSFSVCGTLGGAHVTSVDLSKKYLDWGRDNFALNGLETLDQDFIYGDVFDWLQRFRKRGRTFDGIILDPPTFSQSKVSGLFRAEKDFHRLLKAALDVLRPGGVLAACNNTATWSEASFESCVRQGVETSHHALKRLERLGQPLGFSPSRDEPAYLKTLWIHVV